MLAINYCQYSIYDCDAESNSQRNRTIQSVLDEKQHAAANLPKQFVRMPLADHNDPLTAEYWRKLEQFIAGLK